MGALPTLSLSTLSLADLRQGAVSYDADAVALFARFTTPADAARKALINTLIVALKTAGVWTKLDALYVLAAADAQAARRNWIADSYNLTAVSSPTFTADRGYAGNGSSSYLDTGLNPMTAPLCKFGRDAANMGIWSRTDSNVGSYADMGARTDTATSQSVLFARLPTSGFAQARMNEDTPDVGIAVPNSLGHFVGVRTGAATKRMFRAGALLQAGATSSSVVGSRNLYLGAANTNGVAGVFSPRQYAAAHIGGSLSDAEVLSLYGALNTYLSSVGAA